MNKAIFLDRDGTLIEEVNFLHKPEQVRWIEGVREKLAALYKQGWRLIMVTNQSGVARGYFTMDDVNKVYTYMQDSLRPYGVQFQAMYCCPHLYFPKAKPIAIVLVASPSLVCICKPRKTGIWTYLNL